MSGELEVPTDYTVTSTNDVPGSLVLTNVEVGVVFWGSYWSSTSSPPSPTPATFYQAIVGLVTGPYLTGCRQYRGAGPGTMMGQWIYDTTNPTSGYTESDIETMLADLWKNNSSVPAPDPNHQRFYEVITPPGINSYATGDVGRHTAATFNGITYYHTWIDYVPDPGDPLQGFPGVVKVAGHELAECVTDPVINGSIQVFGSGGIDEISDVCNNESGSLVIQMNSVLCRVQGYWSAADNAGILPEGRLSFALGKSTFGLDEVKEQLKTSNGIFSGAFYLFLDDFSITTFNSFNVNVPIPNTGSFAALSPGVTITETPGTLAAPNPSFENPGNPDQIQRIRYSYDVTFAGQTPSNPDVPVTAFPPTGSTTPFEYSLSATFTTNGVAVGTPLAAMDFELVAGADPYFSSINTLDASSVWWLSRDLRVFSLSIGKPALPGDPNAPTFSGISGYTYIQSLVKYLSLSSQYTVPFAPGSADPLDTLLQGNVDAETSVVPLDSLGNPNYNFAIARVRLTSNVQGPSSAATNTRVFFRLWVAPSFDTDFDPNTTYYSDPAYPGLPAQPLASAASTPPDPTGQQLRTMPYFATINGANDYNGSVPYTNIQTIQIPQGGTLPGGATQDTVYAYYGCFLDIYNNNQATFPDTHHCLVAQIAYDGSPQLYDSSTPIGPGNTDKLAQRNLQIANSGSGVGGGSIVQGIVIQNLVSNDVPSTVTAAAAPVLPTHRTGTAFDSRPSPGPTFGPNSSIISNPDLLMIDWPTDLPVGAKAHIFWPAASSKDVIFLSARLFGGSFLSAEDANTVVFNAIPGSVAYIPIPALQLTAGVGTTPTTQQTYAGLLTIDLPASVPIDAKLDILVRRITTQSKVITPPPPAPQIQRATTATAGNTITWRVVSGAFQVTIPVVGNNELLAGAANTLAILQARLGAMSTQYRWYPVVQRLIGIVSGQVSGSGGDPSQIPPSFNGWPPKKHCGCGDGDDCHHHHHHHHKHGDHDHDHDYGKEP